VAPLPRMHTQPPSPTIPRYISSRQLAEQLGLSEPTLWRMRQRRELPEPVRLSANRVAWPEPVIVAFLAARAAEPLRGPMLPKEPSAATPKSRPRKRKARAR